MVVSFVLRVASCSPEDGQLAGEVEHVPTGARAPFRDLTELGRWCAAVAGREAPPIPPARNEAGPVTRA
jgi:hypothetical protein